MTTKPQRLCHLDEIPQEGCKGFIVNQSENKKELDLFVVRRNDKLFAYKNQCPHTWANLNWQPDVFMDFDNLYIQCAIHGARFEVETGLCVWGPCARQSLVKIDIQIIDKQVFLA